MHVVSEGPDRTGHEVTEVLWGLALQLRSLQKFERPQDVALHWGSVTVATHVASGRLQLSSGVQHLAELGISVQDVEEQLNS